MHHPFTTSLKGHLEKVEAKLGSADNIAYICATFLLVRKWLCTLSLKQSITWHASVVQSKLNKRFMLVRPTDHSGVRLEFFPLS